MNIWVKSLLTGGIAALLVFFLSERAEKSNPNKKYTISCNIKAEPDTNQRNPFSLTKIASVLEKRLSAAAYQHEIKITGANTIKASLFEMQDTLHYQSILTGAGRVQFRELYNISELSVMLTTAFKMMTAMNAPPDKKNAKPVKRDSMSKDVSDLLDSMKINKEKATTSSEELITFSTPYQNETGSPVYPSEIGRVKVKDTAAVKKLFKSDTLKTLSPADAQLCFGQAEKNDGSKKDKQLLPFYFLKPKANSEKALLENEDIGEATQDFDPYGKVEIRLQFNKIGTRKWAAMTRQNIGRSIAMIIDGTVISAPTVINAIEQGVSTISGNYTVQEAQALCASLSGNKLPASLYIVSGDIKPNRSSVESRFKLLMVLITFLTCSSLAFFVLKSLKAT